VKLQRDDWDDGERRTVKDFEPEFEQLRARHRNGPPLELLRAAQAAALPEALQSPLSEHLKQSAWSRALVEEDTEAPVPFDAEAQDRLLARVKRSARPTPAPRWYLRSWVPALAAAAVLIIMVGVFRRKELTRPLDEQPQPSAPAVTAATPVPPAPVFTLALDKPDVKLTQQALVLRSDARGGRFVDDIAPALNAYRANDYAEADRQFSTLQARYPKSTEVLFYRAVTQLFLNDTAGSLRSLAAARQLDDGAFAPEIGWYLAVAYERTGNRTRARAELDTLCRRVSAFTGKACAAASKFRPE
jgi:hypothetical protein